MGGRGASSGISIHGKKYGSGYKTVHEYSNIKFIISNADSTNAPMETMKQGRVYATIDKNKSKVKSITYYDSEGKRFKQIDLTHFHIINGVKENRHVHLGYLHDENGSRSPTNKEYKMINRVLNAWKQYKRG